MATLVMRAWHSAAAPKTTYDNSEDALGQQSRPPTSENPCFPAEFARMAASKKRNTCWSRSPGPNEWTQPNFQLAELH
jgi:hypothetical protein